MVTKQTNSYVNSVLSMFLVTFYNDKNLDVINPMVNADCYKPSELKKNYEPCLRNTSHLV